MPSSNAKSNKWNDASPREPGGQHGHNESDQWGYACYRPRIYGLGSERRDHGEKDPYPICKSGLPHIMQHVARKVAVATDEGQGDIHDHNNLAGCGTYIGAAELRGDKAMMSSMNYKPGFCVASDEQDCDHLQSCGEPASVEHTQGSKPGEQRVRSAATWALAHDLSQQLNDGTIDAVTALNLIIGKVAKENPIGTKGEKTIPLLDEAGASLGARGRLGPIDVDERFAVMPAFDLGPAALAKTPE